MIGSKPSDVPKSRLCFTRSDLEKGGLGSRINGMLTLLYDVIHGGRKSPSPSSWRPDFERQCSPKLRLRLDRRAKATLLEVSQRVQPAKSQAETAVHLLSRGEYTKDINQFHSKCELNTSGSHSDEHQRHRKVDAEGEKLKVESSCIEILMHGSC